MNTFPVLSREALDDAQRCLWDELTLGTRGFYTGGAQATRLPDLYNAWLQFPQFGHLMLRLADELRARTEVPGRLRELIILTTSAALGARVEYDFHVPFARQQGLSDAVIDSIGKGALPVFATDSDRIVHDATLQLLRTATLTPSTRDELIGAIGLPGLMQFMAAVTLYVVTAYTTNVAGVQLAKDFNADPKRLETFFAGPQSPERSD
jgi:4-carboxymuconolactone decarboxylase